MSALMVGGMAISLLLVARGTSATDPRGDSRGDPGAVETPAVFRPSNTTFYFRWTNTRGVVDSQFTWGINARLPVAGEFGL